MVAALVRPNSSRPSCVAGAEGVFPPLVSWIGSLALFVVGVLINLSKLGPSTKNVELSKRAELLYATLLHTLTLAVAVLARQEATVTDIDRLSGTSIRSWMPAMDTPNDGKCSPVPVHRVHAWIGARLRQCTQRSHTNDGFQRLRADVQ